MFAFFSLVLIKLCEKEIFSSFFFFLFLKLACLQFFYFNKKQNFIYYANFGVWFYSENTYVNYVCLANGVSKNAQLAIGGELLAESLSDLIQFLDPYI